MYVRSQFQLLSMHPSWPYSSGIDDSISTRENDCQMRPCCLASRPMIILKRQICPLSSWYYCHLCARLLVNQQLTSLVCHVGAYAVTCGPWALLCAHCECHCTVNPISVRAAVGRLRDLSLHNLPACLLSYSNSAVPPSPAVCAARSMRRTLFLTDVQKYFRAYLVWPALRMLHPQQGITRLQFPSDASVYPLLMRFFAVMEWFIY